MRTLLFLSLSRIIIAAQLERVAGRPGRQFGSRGNQSSGAIKREEIRANIRGGETWAGRLIGTMVHVAHSTVAPGAYYSRLGRIDLAQIHKAILCTDTSTRFGALYGNWGVQRKPEMERKKDGR